MLLGKRSEDVYSLVSKHEVEEEKGPGFSHLHMRLIISDITTC